MSFGEIRFLDEYEKASDTEKFPLVRKWMDHHPLPFFDELRRKRPIFETPVCTLVSRFHDVLEVLNLHDIFNVELYKPKMGSYLMAQDDTPVHFREKAIMRSMLNRDEIPEIRQFVADRAKKILDASKGSIELTQNFSRAVPVTIVQERFGLDGIEPEKQMEWSYWSQYNTFYNQPFDLNDDAESITQKAQDVAKEIGAYVQELIPRKLKDIKDGKAGNDVVSRMLSTQYPESVGFPMDRLGRNVGGLLIGTVETTAQAVSQIVQQILQRPDVKDQAVAAAQESDLEAFDGFVWEALRFHPISTYIFRKAGEDFVLARDTAHETAIKKGTLVLAMTLSAMFDATAFPNPYTFNPKRSLSNTFHFGVGLHECLGKHFGMAIIPEMVRQVLLRPGVKASGCIDYKGTPFPSHYEICWEA